MIISRTPMRISFMGGGTDLPAFYKEEEGLVLSTTINKYMYITVNDRFDETYRLSYSKTEICRTIDEIEHPIFRTVLKKYNKSGRGLELISMADRAWFKQRIYRGAFARTEGPFRGFSI